MRSGAVGSTTSDSGTTLSCWRRVIRAHCRAMLLRSYVMNARPRFLRYGSHSPRELACRAGGAPLDTQVVDNTGGERHRLADEVVDDSDRDCVCRIGSGHGAVRKNPETGPVSSPTAVDASSVQAKSGASMNSTRNGIPSSTDLTMAGVPSWRRAIQDIEGVHPVDLAGLAGARVLGHQGAVAVGGRTAVDGPVSNSSDGEHRHTARRPESHFGCAATSRRATVDGTMTILYGHGPGVCDVEADECDVTLRTFEPDSGRSTELLSLTVPATPGRL